MAWYSGITKGAKKLWKKVGGTKGLQKHLGTAGKWAKKIGDAATKAAPMIKSVLGDRAAGWAEAAGSAATRAETLAGQGRRAAQLAEDTGQDITALRGAWDKRDAGAAWTAGKRAYGRSKGAKRYIAGVKRPVGGSKN